MSPRLTRGGLDLVDDLVVGHRRLAAEEVVFILWVQDRGLDVVAGEGPDRIDRLPQRQGDELGPVALIAPKHPGASADRAPVTTA
jgi:hypothetical protein